MRKQPLSFVVFLKEQNFNLLSNIRWNRRHAAILGGNLPNKYLISGRTYDIYVFARSGGSKSIRKRNQQMHQSQSSAIRESVCYDSPKMQPTLFGVSPATNGFRDPSFGKNKHLPLHRWVPWVAGFSAEFVQDCLKTYLSKREATATVLDPFAGVGTTLIESYLAGLNVVGFEINPYAAFATKLKLRALKIPIDDLSSEITKFERFVQRAEGRTCLRN